MRLTLLSWLGAAFLLVAGIGVVASYVADSPQVAGGSTIPSSLPRSAADGDTLARLTGYARSIQTGNPAPAAAAAAAAASAGQMLPDVNTMIERLAARLETTPEDLEGWRMLGWSYFNTGLYRQAATAYAKAVALDPSSAELKALYEEANTKASESNNLETQTGVTP
jgi:cytochrome c-type biogenesis protein CcmH